MNTSLIPQNPSHLVVLWRAPLESTCVWIPGMEIPPEQTPKPD